MNKELYIELLEEKVDNLEEEKADVQMRLDIAGETIEWMSKKVDECDSCKELLTTIIKLIDTTEIEQYAEYGKYSTVKDNELKSQLLAEWSSVYRLKNKIHEIYDKRG